MKILQTVIVKQVLTTHSKDKLFKKYESHKRQMQKEIDQFKFELKKQEKMKKFSPKTIAVHFEKEIAARQEKIKLVEFQIEQLTILPIGSEIKDQELQSIIEVEVGDQWEKVISGKTILVKDGVISEIRER
ncbi:YlqD family protein [Bacillus sp. 2205SS5-2]|uniref:YlqD family protein n=1 Tax=Bacillus sp. 2205SS5-2 TaxID=3109031 RepID=UPI0030057079